MKEKIHAWFEGKSEDIGTSCLFSFIGLVVLACTACLIGIIVAVFCGAKWLILNT